MTDATGFPLMMEAFEGNKAETKTMLPVITSFMAAHQLGDVTIVADAGMVSEANREAIEDAGLFYIIGARIPEEPYHVKKWRRDHPGGPIPDGHIFAAPGQRPGRGRRPGAETRSPTTATRPTPPGGRSTASTPRSRRPNARSPARSQ
ncbi:hypothetical protein BJ993_004936 [Nocardioides aromaticivorans]|uniref:Transposase IS4-like domain-containing protein n=1 Tax=Nocardioides aromaticivorans TaxID=200618 RepID=A0A7Z0CR90_9ACTN|nr:hypothetical protein [Nocardioides aromaticivorans]